MQTAVYPQSGFCKVSNREKEVLELISQGFSSTEIGTRLFISNHTVNDYRKSLRFKLGAKNVAQMIRKGFELHILNLSII